MLSGFLNVTITLDTMLQVAPSQTMYLLRLLGTILATVISALRTIISLTAAANQVIEWSSQNAWSHHRLLSVSHTINDDVVFSLSLWPPFWSPALHLGATDASTLSGSDPSQMYVIIATSSKTAVLAGLFLVFALSLGFPLSYHDSLPLWSQPLGDALSVWRTLTLLCS
jgi:hypothetical protein